MNAKCIVARAICAALIGLPAASQGQTIPDSTAVVTNTTEATPLDSPPEFTQPSIAPNLADGGSAVVRASFSNIKDAVSGRWFDAVSTCVEAANPNKLLIGFNAGNDQQTWKSNAFIASTNAFYFVSAMDTIAFTVSAPAGYYIGRLTYTQRGTGSISRTAKAAGGASWTVGTDTLPLGMFATSPSLSGTMDLNGQYHRTSLDVSITVGLHTFATPTAGSATISLTSAEVDVGVLPLPSTVLLGAPPRASRYCLSHVPLMGLALRDDAKIAQQPTRQRDR